jgi:hypothetical protein
MNPVTMISKRVERGERVDVRELYGWVAGQVARPASEGDLA